MDEKDWRGNKQFEGVVAICTRGAVLTEVLDGVMLNIMPRLLNGYMWTIKTTHDRPIPDAQNEVTHKALSLQPRLVWYVEEDTAPPVGVLSHLMNLGAEVAVADYRLEGGQMAVTRRNGFIPYSGMGCMLVNRAVFSRISQPWFESGSWTWAGDGFSKHAFELPGHQDVSFFVKLYEHDIKVKALDESWRCRHLRIDKLGERNTNCGLHEIREL